MTPVISDRMVVVAMPTIRIATLRPVVRQGEDAPLGCVTSPEICLPQHDSIRLMFEFQDETGTPVNVSLASEYAFAISASNSSTAPLVEKTKTGGDFVQVSPSIAYCELSSAESGALPTKGIYWEVRIVQGAAVQTVAAGRFTVQNTVIGD